MPSLVVAMLALRVASPGNAQEMRSTVALPIGADVARVVVTEQPGCEVDVLVVHDNEDTGVEAAQAVIAERGGRLVDLQHSGARNLAFALRAQGGTRADSFVVDPNRVFTSAGVGGSLASLSRDTPEARRAVRRFAEQLLAVYGEPAVVVTAHNNTEGRYAATSYAADGPHARNAAALHLEPGADADDFFFVTDRALFDMLAGAGFNAVLQADTATDDGSLSVWAAQQGVPYVNVEAQHGHLAEQTRMMHALWDALCE
ncbi:MAG: protein tyrosine phosphatase [Bacteroidota bacterium]